MIGNKRKIQTEREEDRKRKKGNKLTTTQAEKLLLFIQYSHQKRKYLSYVQEKRQSDLSCPFLDSSSY